VKRPEVEQPAVAVSIRLLVKRAIYLHKNVFGSAVIFSVMADPVNIIRVIIQRPIRVMFEMVIITGLGQLLRRLNIVSHIVVLPAALQRAAYEVARGAA
jgi:TRAP-type mannitol/chloroaromatic compound transport system permease small subunit